MSKFKTSYSINWEEQIAWVKKAKEPDSALCTICKKFFKIDGSGLAQVKDLIKNRKVTRRKNRQTLIRENSLLVTREVLVLPQESFHQPQKSSLKKLRQFRY